MKTQILLKLIEHNKETMDLNRKQYDSLSLGYYRGVISHKEILYEQNHFRVD